MGVEMIQNVNNCVNLWLFCSIKCGIIMQCSAAVYFTQILTKYSRIEQLHVGQICYFLNCIYHNVNV